LSSYPCDAVRVKKLHIKTFCYFNITYALVFGIKIGKKIWDEDIDVQMCKLCEARKPFSINNYLNDLVILSLRVIARNEAISIQYRANITWRIPALGRGRAHYF